jgi:hypothetical protein
MSLPKAGDVVHLTREASVQFTKPIFFRVIRVLDRVTYDGWCWLDGYSLDDRGDAVARRSVYVRKAGLRFARQNPPAPRRAPSSATRTPKR